MIADIARELAVPEDQCLTEIKKIRSEWKQDLETKVEWYSELLFYQRNPICKLLYKISKKFKLGLWKTKQD